MDYSHVIRIVRMLAIASSIRGVTSLASAGVFPQLQKRPPWLGVCSRRNPNENQCFRALFENCFPALATGIPEVGVNSFEPLHIGHVSVSKGSGNLILTGGFTNLTIRGPSNATVKTANLDLVKKKLNFALEIPVLRIRAKYNIRGKLLLLPIRGSGDVNLLLRMIRTSIFTNISMRYEPEEIIHIDQMAITFDVDKMRIHLSNLFNGNEILANSLNTFLNENDKEIISELRPDLEQGLAVIFHGLWNNFFSKLPTRLWLL